MPRRRKAPASPQTLPWPRLPETPPETPPTTPVVSQRGEIQAQENTEPQVSFPIHVLGAVPVNAQARPSCRAVSVRFRRFFRYGELCQSCSNFTKSHGHSRSICHNLCCILFYPYTVFTTIKHYPKLRGSIIGSHGLLLTILISILIKYDSIIRVCYGSLLGISKLGELCYAAPQGIRYLAELGLQWKVLYFNLDTAVVLSSSALQKTGYLAAKTTWFVSSQWTRLIDHLNDPTPPWELP